MRLALPRGSSRELLPTCARHRPLHNVAYSRHADARRARSRPPPPRHRGGRDAAKFARLAISGRVASLGAPRPRPQRAILRHGRGAAQPRLERGAARAARWREGPRSSVSRRPQRLLATRPRARRRARSSAKVASKDRGMSERGNDASLQGGPHRRRCLLQTRHQLPKAKQRCSWCSVHAQYASPLLQ